MRIDLTTEPQHIIVSVKRGEQARCPICGRLFIEAMNGSDGRNQVTCKDHRHPRGVAVRIEFVTG